MDLVSRKIRVFPDRRSSDQPAERTDDIGVLRAVAGGDPEELAGLETFLVVAGPGVDPAPDQQPADELLGDEPVAELHQGEVGRGWVDMQPVDLGQRGEEPPRVADEPDALPFITLLEIRAG